MSAPRETVRTAAVSTRGDGPRTVLFLHRGGDQVRGSEHALLTLIDGLDPQRFRSVVACSSAALLPALAERSVPAAVCEFPEVLLTSIERQLPIWSYLRALLKLGAMAHRERAALIVANGGGPCQLAVPLSAMLRLPLVAVIHHPAPRTYHTFWLTRFVRTLVYVSEYTARHTRAFIGEGGGVIYPGIDLGRFRASSTERDALRERLAIPGDAVVFLQVGAVVAHKGHRTLLDAFARVQREHASARLFIVGDGPDVPALRLHAETLGISEHVTFTGYVDDVLPYLEAADVNVLPSREEGLGLVTLEAGACGVPTIGADGTGIRETIVDGHTGLLFPAGDVDALAQRMTELLQDPGRRTRMGARARAEVAARFSGTLFTDRMQRLLCAVLGEHRSGVVVRRRDRWYGDSARPLVAEPA